MIYREVARKLTAVGCKETPHKFCRNIRRSDRDWADVVELIVARNLDHRFAGLLHKAVRKEYRSLVKRARGEA